MKQPRPSNAVQRLVNREEVLQICFWLDGEGLASSYEADFIERFIDAQTPEVEAALTELANQGKLVSVAGQAGTYRFTDAGRKLAGRLFADGFSDMQKAGHGECAAGCCDGDDHSQCGSDCALSPAAG